MKAVGYMPTDVRNEILCSADGCYDSSLGVAVSPVRSTREIIKLLTKKDISFSRVTFGDVIDLYHELYAHKIVKLEVVRGEEYRAPRYVQPLGGLRGPQLQRLLEDGWKITCRRHGLRANVRKYLASKLAKKASLA